MYTFQSLKINISPQQYPWLASILLLNVLIFLFLLVNRVSIPHIRLHEFEAPVDPRVDDNQEDEECPFGRVYVYDLPSVLNKDLLNTSNKLSNGGFGLHATGLESVMDQNLTEVWYWTDLYSGEVIYHNRMLCYKCRTLDQDQAIAFYIPFYVGVVVGKYLWANHTAKEMDFHSVTMLNWVKNRPPWKRSNGSDHFIVLGRLTWDFRRITADSDTEWGTSLLNMSLMENVLRLSPERSIWDPLEVSIPYPNPFHPRYESDIRHWQSVLRAKNRSRLFSMVGGARKHIKHDFRAVLLTYCKEETEYCKMVDCSVTPCYNGAAETMEAFLDSDFCLQPKGDGFTRRATFDCMLAGSIPVFFWKGSFENQYRWHMPLAAETYSVFIDNKDVRNDTSIIRHVLEKYSREEVERLREKVIDLMPNFLIAESGADLGSLKDAFDITMNEVLQRFKQQKESAFTRD